MKSSTGTASPERRAQKRIPDGKWRTALTDIEPNKILLRGYAVDELMGRLTFGEAIYLLLMGEIPSPSMGTLMDAMLVSFIDHGTTPPSTLSARNTATTGAPLRACVAAGVLGFGTYHGGDIERCQLFLDGGLDLVREGQSYRKAAETIVERCQATDQALPGFGHRYHTIDPRATRLLQLAHELEVDQAYTQLLRALEHEFTRHQAFASRPLPINVDGAVAAICADVGLPPEVADALLIISRVPGLAAHALEEQQREAPMRAIDPTSHAYDGPKERRMPERRS